MGIPHHTQRNLSMDLTYWEPLNNPVTNDFGHAVTGKGVLIKGRWEDSVQQIRRPNGDEVTSTSVVYVDRELAVGGFLYNGDMTDQLRGETAREIQSFLTTPDLRNLGSERRAFL